LAALTAEPIEALRTLFLDDRLSRPLADEQQIGGLMDRTSGEWVVFDLAGTREAARERCDATDRRLAAALAEVG